MRKNKIAMMILTLLTIFTIGISAYAYAQPTPITFCFLYYEAFELEEKPDKYFALNESHVYVVEAINKPGQLAEAELCILNETTLEWMDADGIPDTFLDDANKYGTDNVEYKGKYYLIGVLWAEPPFDIHFRRNIRTYIPTGWIALSTLWAGVAIITLHGRTTTRQSL